MKIAMVTSVPFPPVCGIGHYICNLSDKLVDRGHEVIVLTRGGPKKQVATYSKFTVYKLPFIEAYPFHVDIHGLFLNQFLKAISQDIDVIHAHSPLTPALITERPIVTTFHSPHFADAYSTDLADMRQALTRYLAIFDYRIEKAIISSSNVISSVSNGVKQDLERYYHMNPQQIRVFGNAVNDRYLNRSPESKKDPSKILYVGRLDYEKGLTYLVESMQIVTNAYPEARLVLIGEGPFLPQLKKQISELNLQKLVEIKGYLVGDKLLSEYRSAAIFALPSHHEGLSTALLEAMACKAAVIASDVRGNTDAVKAGFTGLLVPKKDPNKLGDAIVYLLGHPDVREELAQNAKSLVEENFTWEKVTDRVVDAYKAAMAE